MLHNDRDDRKDAKTDGREARRLGDRYIVVQVRQRKPLGAGRQKANWYERRLGSVTASATATHALTLGAPYAHSTPVCGFLRREEKMRQRGRWVKRDDVGGRTIYTG